MRSAWTAAATALTLVVMGVPGAATGAATAEDVPTARGPAPAQAPSLRAAGTEDPVAPTIAETALTPEPAAPGLAGAPGAGSDVPADVVAAWSATVTPTGEEAVAGVVWSPATDADLTVEMRWGGPDAWGPWTEVEVDPVAQVGSEGGGDPEVRDGTEPVFVGAADAVEARVLVVGPGRLLDPELVVVDPGSGSVDAEAARASSASGAAGGLGRTASIAAGPPLVTTTPAGGALSTTTDRPYIHTRAQWGADERLMTWTPQTGRVVGAVVHHTAGSNDYTAEQVPALIRGIYAYHAQSRGWGDIGYNFLVDKFGRIWEGRAGGVDRANVGAHAAGVNSERFGVSVLGNFDAAQVTVATVDAVSRLVAWKLSLHGVRPTGSAIVGHRDVGQTSCPGASLYAALPQIRSLATARQGPFEDRSLQRDLGSDGYADLLAVQSSGISLLTAPGAGWGATRTVGSGWEGERVIAPGDWNGDGNPDLMLVDRSSGALWLYPGTSSGGWAARQRIGVGWGVFDLVVGGHDWNGDGRTDLLARRHDGSLWLYPGNGRGGFGETRRIGAGWGGMTAVTMIGSLRDGRPALVARTNGSLYTYVGDGKGGFAGSRGVLVGPGWDAMTSIVGAGDVNDDGQADVVARDRQGTLWRYIGDGVGGVTGRSAIGVGWQSFTAVVPAGRLGRGEDFFAVRPDGALLRYSFAGGAAFNRISGTGISSSGVVEAIAPGDWNGDGRPDIMTRRQNGDLYLHSRTSSGTFDPRGTRVGNGWGGMTQVIGAGDWLGTGAPGLIAFERTAGRIWLYPGDGRGGFASRVLLASGAHFLDRLVNVGHWRGGAVPDLLAREAGTGRLLLYPSNGGARVGPSRVVGQGWQGMSSMVGVGDADGDGRPDLVAVTSGGVLRLYPGDGAGGFLVPRTLPGSGGTRVS